MTRADLSAIAQCLQIAHRRGATIEAAAEIERARAPAGDASGNEHAFISSSFLTAPARSQRSRRAGARASGEPAGGDVDPDPSGGAANVTMAADTLRDTQPPTLPKRLTAPRRIPAEVLAPMLRLAARRGDVTIRDALLSLLAKWDRRDERVRW